MSGIIKIRIEGLNFNKIVNALIDEGVYLKNIKTRVKNVSFEIYEKQFEKFKTICKKFHKRYIILSKNNLINYIKHLRYYLGFLFATIFAFICIASGFIMRLMEHKLQVPRARFPLDTPLPSLKLELLQRFWEE